MIPDKDTLLYADWNKVITKYRNYIMQRGKELIPDKHKLH
jgi:hypothetical protein